MNDSSPPRRTVTVVRYCPRCDAPFRIPLTVSSRTGRLVDAREFELACGLGCPNQFVPGHGPLTVAEIRHLVRRGASPAEYHHSSLLARVVRCVAPHRTITLDGRG